MSDYSQFNMSSTGSSAPSFVNYGGMSNGINMPPQTSNFVDQRQFLHQNPHEQFAASQLNLSQPANMVFSQLNSLMQNGLGQNSFQGIPASLPVQGQQLQQLQQLQQVKTSPVQSFPGDFPKQQAFPAQNGIIENMGNIDQRFDSFSRGSNGSVQTNIQPVKFGVEMKPSGLPKLIALAEAPNNGNIHLYEISKASILMVTNPPNMRINLQGLVRTDKSYDTPHGPKTGYIFYKNRPEHLNMIDQLFPGSNWREQLVEGIPPPLEKKDPTLLWSGYLNYGGIEHSTYLYEYSEKSLALFTTVDLKDQLPKCKLQCPHVGGTEYGYSVWKGKSEHIQFLKNSIRIPIDFESKYTKSQPKATKVERDPICIFNHPFDWNGTHYEIEVYEYSELSVAVFTTPIFSISGLTVTEGLVHPTQGRRQGMLISKSNDANMSILKNYIQKHDLETLFVMEPQKSTRGDILNSFPSVQTEQTNPRSYDDIPLDTLVRILRTNLDKQSDEPVVRDLIGNETMIYGNCEKVSEKLELYTDAEVKLKFSAGDKVLIIIKNDDYV